MGKHEAPEPKPSLHRRLGRHVMHPVTHIVTLVSLHVVALAVLEKTPLLELLLLH